METIKSSMEGAFNEFINGHKEVKSTRVSLIQFDDMDPQEIVYQDVPVNYVEKLRIRPRGNTPLIDAMCTAIDNVGKRLANKDESERPDQVLFVIITDGQENASKRYKRADVNSRVQAQSENYKWRFIYLGANQDAIQEAQSYGILPQYAINYAHNNIGTARSMNALMSNTLAYASSNGANRGNDELLKFTQKQRKQAVESDTE
jgi:uncharacterized protein YegL